MNLRVTSQFLSSQLVYHNRIQIANIANLQYQVSSGLRYSRPSDNPSATQHLFSLNRTMASLNSDHANMESVRHTLNVSVSTLTEGHKIMRHAQRIALDARQADSASLESMALEVDGLRDRMLQLANMSENDRYLYAGQADHQQPYVKNPDGAFPPYLYRGSLQALAVPISDNITADSLSDGSAIFGSQARTATTFIGTTGAVTGTGTDSGISRDELSVVHKLTTYQGASGLAAGTNSGSGDTIIGNVGTHTVELIDQSGTGASGTVSLNGGDPIAWTSADTNLRVEDKNGDVVFLDTSSIAAGFNGAVGIQADGQLSTDNGLTWTAIDFSSNQIIIDSTTGQVTNVDSTGIMRTGVEYIDYSGTSDAFSVLAELSSDLRNQRNLNRDQISDSLVRREQDIERHAERIINTVGEQSSTLESIEALSNRNRAFRLEIATVVDEVEGADMTEVIVQLQQQQNLLQFSYAISSSMLSQSILQFLS